MIEFQWESCVLGIFIGSILVLFVFYLIALRGTKEVETEEIDNQVKMRRLHQRDFDLLQAGFEKLNLNVNLYRDGAKANYRDLNLLTDYFGLRFDGVLDGTKSEGTERRVVQLQSNHGMITLGLHDRLKRVEDQVDSGWAEQQALCDKKVAHMRDEICGSQISNLTAAGEIRKINRRFDIVSRVVTDNDEAIARLLPDSQDALKRIASLEERKWLIKPLPVPKKKAAPKKKPAAKKPATKKPTPKRKAK